MSGGEAPEAVPRTAMRAWERGRPSVSGISTRLRLRRVRAGVAALVIGLLVTAGLTVGSRLLYQHNEKRLLELRLRELNLVLAASGPSIQSPLSSAAELANETGASAQKFRSFMMPLVGPGRQFTSASLWRLGTPHPRPTVVLGAAPMLLSRPDRGAGLFTSGKRAGVLNLAGILGTSRPVIGFEFTPSNHQHGYAVYAENALPADRRSRIESNSAFSDLYYVLYLGHSRRSSDLLVTNVSKLPLHGRQDSGTVPFGSGVFTLVVGPRGALGGAFFRDLPWIVALAGVLISLAAALLIDRLARGRERAERLAQTLDRLASEIGDRYREQRSVAKALQHALLPERLPQLAGLKVGALYVPASAELDIGGDWYDAIEVADGRLLMIIGDVSGHGLQAATTMAMLRHAALAYVAVDPDPGVVLQKLSNFAQHTALDGSFATVLCALVDVPARRLTMASAGHLPPLVLARDGATFVEMHIGPAIGVTRTADYRETSTSVPERAIVVAFTDGLVERRGEVLDVGLERLRRLAEQRRAPLGELLTSLTGELASINHEDDTAIVGVQWQG
jgi:serine phosphatase RsbU (regulator of sigma subunit)